MMYVVTLFFIFKQKTAYELRISDWSSDVCSSDLGDGGMEHPGHGRATASGAPVTQNRLRLIGDLGLNEQLIERGVRIVGRRGREHHFGIAGQIDGFWGFGTIGYAHPSYFKIVVRAYGNIGA